MSTFLILEALVFSFATVAVLCGIIVVTQPWDEWLPISAEKARKVKEAANSIGPASAIVMAWLMLLWLFLSLLKCF